MSGHTPAAAGPRATGKTSVVSGRPPQRVDSAEGDPRAPAGIDPPARRRAGGAAVRTSRDRFPRDYAVTRRFSLGEPRNLAVAGNGRWVTFLRSRSGTDPVTCLWALDTRTGKERLVADPATLFDDRKELAKLNDAERRRRERARESAEGITSYALDEAGEQACFAVAGHLFLVDVAKGKAAPLPAMGSVFDPRLDPAGTRVAYVSERALRVVGPLEEDRKLAGEDNPEVSWGVAEFIAAEEMGRSRGFWWSPTGQHLAVCRVDNSPVETWYLADPAHPERQPSPHRYPRAGSNNATVELFVVGLDGSRVAIRWDQEAFPYLVSVSWQPDRPLTLAVQSRDQRRVEVLVADVVEGTTRAVHTDTDEIWVELVAGAPRWLGEHLVVVVDRDDIRQVEIGGRPVTGADLAVRAVLGTLGEDLVVSASLEPTEVHLFRVSAAGEVVRLTQLSGVHSGVAGGDILAVSRKSMTHFGAVTEIRKGAKVVAELTSVAERPKLNPRGAFHVVGTRSLRTALLLPRRKQLTPPYPVLLDPYGGPHAQRVLRSRNELLVSQWFADQGFAVLIVDGRGTPGRSPAWERAVWGDLAGPVLDDQVDALQALGALDDRLDLTRVGIRGWSFGGYLAALAVLRRPDVFGAAVAGAPVTDWRLYDTHYTERYLGHPDEYGEHYEHTSLINDAARLQRPLLLIHGLADDNVVVAHTLQLSSALLAAGRSHSVLPLSGVTHMTPQEAVAENLLRLQAEFLRRSLGMEDH
ncbi:MAG: prolyl oligopeptidase family serine peptidase [Acidimicrobiales bacterium]